MAACGTYVARAPEDRLPGDKDAALTWEFGLRAGDGNRNRMTSLEGWGSTIELRPRGDYLRCPQPTGWPRRPARGSPRLHVRARVHRAGTLPTGVGRARMAGQVRSEQGRIRQA